MKKLAIVAAVVVGLLTMHVQTASAKDMSGRFGVGVDSGLGWTAVQPAVMGAGGGNQVVNNQGLSLVYFISKMFGVQLIAGAQFTLASADNDVEYSANLINVGVRGLIPIAFTNDVNLNAVVGFSGTFFSDDNGNDTDEDDASRNFISFDIGIRPEWFITEHFSIHTQVGFAISLLNEDNYGLGAGTGGVDLNVFNNGDLFGSAGWTFWF